MIAAQLAPLIACLCARPLGPVGLLIERGHNFAGSSMGLALTVLAHHADELLELQRAAERWQAARTADRDAPGHGTEAAELADATCALGEALMYLQHVQFLEKWYRP